MCSGFLFVTHIFLLFQRYFWVVSSLSTLVFFFRFVRASQKNQLAMSILEAVPPFANSEVMASEPRTNALTGLLRRRARRHVNYKRRATHSHSVLQKNLAYKFRFAVLRDAKLKNLLSLTVAAVMIIGFC